MMVPSRSSRTPGRRMFGSLTSVPPQLLSPWKINSHPADARLCPPALRLQECHQPRRDHLHVVVAAKLAERGLPGAPELLLGLQEGNEDLGPALRVSNRP